MFPVLLLLGAALGALLVYLYRAESRLRLPWVPDAEARLFAQRPLPPPLDDTFLSSPNYTLPLRTRGRDVIDARGRRFKLASVNWYGASDELFVPGGLDVKHRDEIARMVRVLGFNSVRLPYADELVLRNPVVAPHLLAANPDLVGRRAMDVLEAVVDALTRAGIAVIVNNHITSATWCCGADPCDAGWANDHLPSMMCRVRQTEEEWIEHWEEVMRRFVGNPLGGGRRPSQRGARRVVTMKCEPLATAVERAGIRLLKMTPDWLIIVRRNRVAERPHRRGGAGPSCSTCRTASSTRPTSICGAAGAASAAVTPSAHYPSFVQSMQQEIGPTCSRGDIAPVWVGKFGAPPKPRPG
ncbi:hypothetical protein CHGG_01863 [Chaetomium globosum CBS 148.51]|uniref:Glycoside hydrolase family 5 domain-containing protein n=1 Tax=Chaetomium globosum (strain ATCC 6205 / CBS 148.51 / DSM 1962 / NBRC 6347 / NRRL 1970) TaxID=306901 RepID=Q2HD41_CHAGB|nr:uncharacterized protein CHGG_01863 [Chaetomium globosum CBS 148.51]EAQ93628.1 hypothetical protein CHGG_01863 [Chaetomium globosum CBS 148.51]